MGSFDMPVLVSRSCAGARLIWHHNLQNDYLDRAQLQQGWILMDFVHCSVGRSAGMVRRCDVS